METEVDIQASLKTLGDLLTFIGFTLYGIPESDKVYLEHSNGISQIASKEYFYLLSTKDCVTKAITIDTVFTITDGTLTYTFKVAKPHDPTGDGWSRLTINLTAQA
jgi:hypothetical protein